jgi:two-component system chemotaxis response regulator CheB
MEKEGVIVIGGSAGSIEVIMNLLPTIPENFPCPIVVVIHRKNTLENHLVDVLNKKCRLNVIEIQDKMQLERNTIYLAPGDYHLLVDAHGCLNLDYSEKVNFSRPSIDVTFDSFALAFTDKCIGVLLSGANADGAKGLESIKNSGGISIVQSPESSTIATMPMAAIKLFKPDIILSPSKIAELLFELSQSNFEDFRSKYNVIS